MKNNVYDRGRSGYQVVKDEVSLKREQERALERAGLLIDLAETAKDVNSLVGYEVPNMAMAVLWQDWKAGLLPGATVEYQQGEWEARPTEDYYGLLDIKVGEKSLNIPLPLLQDGVLAQVASMVETGRVVKGEKGAHNRSDKAIYAQTKERAVALMAKMDLPLMERMIKSGRAVLEAGASMIGFSKFFEYAQGKMDDAIKEKIAKAMISKEQFDSLLEGSPEVWEREQQFDDGGARMSFERATEDTVIPESASGDYWTKVPLDEAWESFNKTQKTGAKVYTWRGYPEAITSSFPEGFDYRLVGDEDKK